MTGEVVAGRYELEELVGSGGMSSVYRAHDRLLERKVALKILHARFLEDEEYIERFRREARSVAQLAHPNIVTVIDRGEDDGRQFIVFEYVDGDNLKQAVERVGPFPVDEVIERGLEIASGLAYAHERGIVHRDVKPQNVLLNGDGRAKVTDFGIARSLDVEHGVTQTGTVLGTSSYIAPEQASGQPVDDRSDVYSLGVVLFELATGEVPFPGDNFVSVAMQHVHEPAPHVLDRRGDVPAALADLIDRMLVKEHTERPAMTEVVAELEALRGTTGSAQAPDAGGETMIVSRPTAPRARRRRPAGRSRLPLPLVLAALGAVLLGAALGALLLRDGGGDGEAAPPAERPQVVAVRAVDPTGDGEHDAEVPLATDGKRETAWRTSSYSYPDGGLGKPGVGIELEAKGSPKELVILTETPGFTAEIRSGDTVVAEGRKVEDGTAFPLPEGVKGPFTVWITNRGEHRAVRINEVTAG